MGLYFFSICHSVDGPIRWAKNANPAIEWTVLAFGYEGRIGLYWSQVCFLKLSSALKILLNHVPIRGVCQSEKQEAISIANAAASVLA